MMAQGEGARAQAQGEGMRARGEGARANKRGGLSRRAAAGGPESPNGLIGPAGGWPTPSAHGASGGPGGLSRRAAAAVAAAAIAAAILAIYVGGALLPDSALAADFSQKALPPSPRHIFGTDYLGRDMFARTVKGLALSLTVGAAASAISAAIALAVGTVAALGSRAADHAVNWFIDVFMSVPHTVLIILISIAFARGATGMLIGVAITHWVGLARIIRGEAMQVRSQPYIAASRGFGKPPLWIALNHMLPHLAPQFFVGLVLLFPHAIMHESGLTFLGFGMPPEQPAIGIILSEAMRYISSGALWLAFFPGLSLVLLVLLIEALGSALRRLLEPREAQM